MSVLTFLLKNFKGGMEELKVSFDEALLNQIYDKIALV